MFKKKSPYLLEMQYEVFKDELTLFLNRRLLNTFIIYLHILFSLEDIYIDFRERGREGEREGERHASVASHTCPTGDILYMP